MAIKKIEMRKRAVFFSIDALIAVAIILLVIIVAYPAIKYSKRDSQLHYDVITTLSSLKIGEINNVYVQSLISSGVINNTNKSVLEQIGEFYVTDVSLARSLANSVLSDLSASKNIGLWYSGTLIASFNKTSIETADDIEVARQIISGIKEGESVTGFSARAFLSSDLQRKYFYFGGYVGDGNISARVEYVGNISAAEMELVINDNFDLYINGIFSVNYSKSDDDFTPKSYVIPIDDFKSGANLVEIRGKNLHIAGGFIKIIYQSTIQYGQPEKYFFPGINGLVNIYDGFYIPGDLSSLDISLHFNSPYILFLTIENKTVFRNVSAGEQTITIPNSELSSMLNYASLSRRTIPLRFGLENVSYVTAGISIFADVFSVIDISGSMGWGIPPKINQAKDANKLLVSSILNISGNRVGLVAYSDEAEDSWFHSLSSNNNSLISMINSYTPQSATCICCGINKAIAGFNRIIPNVNSGIVGSRVSQSTDDAEERVSNGAMSLTSGNLRIVTSGNTLQEVGLRFQNINIPQGALITNAYLEFEASGTDSGVTNLNFFAEDSNNAQTFSSSSYDITQRAKTSAKVVWSNVPAWSTGEKHQTPDLSSVIQEVVDRVSWASGNSIVVIVNGSGRRTAESWDGDVNNAPLLVVTYSLEPLSCSDGDIDAGEECDDGNFNNNDACTNACTNAVCRDGVVWNEGGGNEECDDAGICTGDDLTFCASNSDCVSVGGTCTARNMDGCSSSCEEEDRLKTMIVLSDGMANVECPEQGTGDAALDAIKAAEEACDNYNITVYSVGFGSDADETTLQQLPHCNGDYYFGDVGEISEIYGQIAESIMRAVYEEQTIAAIGNITTLLYSDSFIEFNYTKDSIPYGLTSILEKQFYDEFSGNFTLPQNSDIIETKVTSYSGPRWTDKLNINGYTLYNLSSLGSEYTKLGDPYVISIPNYLIQEENNVKVTTGISPLNSTEGSLYNKIIYTIVKNASAYSAISAFSDGCNWEVQFEDDTNISASIPASYSGANTCRYMESSIVYNENDAAQNAIYELFKILDFDSDNKVNFKFVEEDLEIELTEMTNIPYTWATEVQVRTWY